MVADLNRRSFLKGALAAAGAAAASGVPLPQAVQAASGRELATMLDLSKCIGCEACVEACRDANDKYTRDPLKPIPKMFPAKVEIEDWSDRKNETSRLTPYNWLYVQSAEVKINGKNQTFYMPRRCMHCQNPPCANLCPWGAAYKTDLGLSVIDPDVCLGGAKCKQVCPWEIPQRQSGVGLYLKLMPAYAGNGVMFKCHRCYERLAKGQTPACIEICPEKVQTIGPRSEIMAKAQTRAKEINGYIYGDKENGGTNTIYVSPVPFDQIDRAVQTKIDQVVAEKVKAAVKEKGSQVDQAALANKIAKQERAGRPKLGAVPNSMAQAENLTWALLIAPIAGLAGAVGRLRKTFQKSTDNDHRPKPEVGHHE